MKLNQILKVLLAFTMAAIVTPVHVNASTGNRTDPQACEGDCGSSTSKILSVPGYKQENEIYCGPASVQNIIKANTGNYVSQSTLASTSYLWTDYYGNTGAEFVANTLTSLAGATYTRQNNNSTNFYSSYVSTIDKGYLACFNVLTSKLGTGYIGNYQHYIVGYGYNGNYIVIFDPWTNLDGGTGGGTHTNSSSTLSAALNANYGYYYIVK